MNKGFYTALGTPLDENLSVCEKSFANEIEQQIEAAEVEADLLQREWHASRAQASAELCSEQDTEDRAEDEPQNDEKGDDHGSH